MKRAHERARLGQKRRNVPQEEQKDKEIAKQKDFLKGARRIIDGDEKLCGGERNLCGQI
jgi:hypothetical protein